MYLRNIKLHVHNDKMYIIMCIIRMHSFMCDYVSFRILSPGITGNNEISYYDTYNIGIVTMNSKVKLTFDNFKSNRAN